MTFHGHKDKKLEAAMREVHAKTPSTVTRADVHGAKKEAMLRAIAFSKAGMSKKKYTSEGGYTKA